MNSFIIYPILAGCSLSLITGPLGVFIIWRRMAFFGDTLAHSALTGVALSLLLDIALYPSLVIVPLVIAIFLTIVQSQKLLSSDTWLAIAAHGTLAIGIVALSFQEVQVDIMAYLFGDILAVSKTNLWQIGISVAIILSILISIWRPLLTITVNEELAHVEGVRVRLVRTTFMILIALTVALAIKIIGTLLLTAMLIIPAAAARPISTTPERMAIFAIIICCLAVFTGVQASFFIDTPTSPTIVVAALCICGISWFFRNKINFFAK